MLQSHYRPVHIRDSEYDPDHSHKNSLFHVISSEYVYNCFHYPADIDAEIQIHRTDESRNFLPEPSGILW